VRTCDSRHGLYWPSLLTLMSSIPVSCCAVPRHPDMTYPLPNVTSGQEPKHVGQADARNEKAKTHRRESKPSSISWGAPHFGIPGERSVASQWQDLRIMYGCLCTRLWTLSAMMSSSNNNSKITEDRRDKAISRSTNDYPTVMQAHN